jgi:glycine dehydrogenase subunit 1
MLSRVGVSSFEDLLKPIPEMLRLSRDLDLPLPMAEVTLVRHLKDLASKNQTPVNFIGAGSYEHFRPAVVDYVCGRPEFRTAYTPYQAEVSQGTLQTIYEFQTSVVELLGMDVANASMYDGGSGAAEASLMALAATRRNSLLVSAGLHPFYRQVITTYVAPKGTEIIEIPLHSGHTVGEELRNHADQAAAIIYQQPNFLGCVENQKFLIDVAHEGGALAVAVVDPLSAVVLEPPGSLGADIVVAEGQGLAIPTYYGGPGVGLLTCSKQLLRRLPGRIAGATVDEHGRRGFVLTLQAREQHIRRHRAASNICTNQALVALAFLTTLSTLGPHGLRELAEQCIQKAHYLADRLAEHGFDRAFDSPFLWEFSLKTGLPASHYVKRLLPKGYLPGYDLGSVSSAWENYLLIYVSELRTREELDTLVTLLSEADRGC